MLHIAAYLKALGKYWWALMSSALFTILSVYAAATNRSNTWFFWASIVLIFCSLLIASFLAWREEFVANLAGPQILIDWTSHEHGHDTISFRNVGTETAF